MPVILDCSGPDSGVTGSAGQLLHHGPGVEDTLLLNEGVQHDLAKARVANFII